MPYLDIHTMWRCSPGLESLVDQIFAARYPKLTTSSGGDDPASDSPTRGDYIMRRRILVTALALLGAAVLIVPAANQASAQAGTKGVGAARTGVGPGTNAGDPGITDNTGPGSNPAANSSPAPGKQAKKQQRKSRHTTGSK
jgi:hypothetical protein